MFSNFTILRWWVIFCALTISSIILQYKGMFLALWVADLSGTSFVALILFSILTLFIGYLTVTLTKNVPDSSIFKRNVKFLHACWWASELLMALGMIGTLIGFMIMLGPTLMGINLSNQVAAAKGIFGMASGIGTAVSATLTGLITSQLIKLQLINLEISLENDVE